MFTHADPFPPEEVTVYSESVDGTSALVNLKWSPQSSTSYNITLMPTRDAMMVIGNSILVVNTTVSLTLSYNVLYNVSVAAILCGKESTPTFIALNYGRQHNTV